MDSQDRLHPNITENTRLCLGVGPVTHTVVRKPLDAPLNRRLLEKKTVEVDTNLSPRARFR
jgi:hypothetical protein